MVLAEASVFGHAGIFADQEAGRALRARKASRFEINSTPRTIAPPISVQLPGNSPMMNHTSSGASIDSISISSATSDDVI